MARVVLAVYLMFAVAAGPWLCCCAGDHSLSRFSGDKHAPTTGCCSHHRSPSGSQHLPANGQRSDRPLPHDSCACNGMEQPITILVAKASLDIDCTLSRTLSQEFAPRVFGAAELLTHQLPLENAGFAFTSLQHSRDILSILQTLRC